MTSSIRDISYQLRQGQLIALADETGWSVAADPVNDTAVAQLLTLRALLPNSVPITVLIPTADQLGMYVAKLPDVAYDLIDFAENPLTVVFDQGKNMSVQVWAVAPADAATEPPTAGGVAVRRSLNPDIQRLLGSFGRGVLTVPFESLVLPPAAESLVSDRFGVLPAMPKRPRIMQLRTNGEVSFVRK